MSKLSLREIAQSQLDSTPVIDGQLIVCLDTGNAYRDTAMAHVKIGSDLEVVSDLPLAPRAEKLYYLKPDKLYVFLGGNWTLLNDKTIDLDESIAKLPAGTATDLNDDVEIITQDTDFTQPHYYRRKLVVLWEYIKAKAQDFFAAKDHKHKKADITDFPTSMPASDVHPWAKEATKPSYTKDEVGLGNVDNTADADKTVKRATTAGTADTANSVTWENVKDKPTTFPVADHNHDSRYYTESEMDGKLSGKVNDTETGANGFLAKLTAWTANPTDDTYFIRQETGGKNQFGRVKFSTLWNYIKGKADGTYQPKGSYAASDHTHDDRYYTESEIDSKLSGKADTKHIHLNGTASGNVDWNTFITYGVYKIQNCTMSDAYHAPNPEYQYGILQVLDSENNVGEKRILQIYWPHSTAKGNHLWYRMHNSSDINTGWSGWTQIKKKPDAAGVADSANALSGLSSRSSQGWGVQTGTFVHGECDSTGGDFAFRRDCPNAGQMSMVIDGRFYQNEGNYRVLDTSDEPNLNVNSAKHVKDVGTNKPTTFAYSKDGMNYGDYTWLAGWNGYELRAVHKNQFATAGHTHDMSTLTGNVLNTEPGTSNHKVVLGKSGLDKCEFYEYGGIWNFYKMNPSQSLVASIQPDGIHAALKGTADVANVANFAKETYISQYKTVNLTDLDQNTWYPVTGDSIPYNGLRRFKCNVQLNSGSKPNWSTHSSGFTAVVDLLCESSGWGTTNMLGMVLTNDQYWINDYNKPPVGYGQMSAGSIPVWWLRGGGSYRLATDYDITWTIQKSTYTNNGQSVSPTTTYPGVNVNRSTIVANLNGTATRANNADTAANSDKWAGLSWRHNHNTTDTWIPVVSDNAFDYILKHEISADKLPLTGGTLTGALHIKQPNSGSYNENIRIHPSSSNWTCIAMCGDDNTGDSGTSAKTWGIFTYNGEISIAKNGTSLNGGTSNASLTCKSDNVWRANNVPLLTTDSGIPKSGGTMSGALNFANNTWNLVGDDAYIGDHNIGGAVCFVGANSGTKIVLCNKNNQGDYAYFGYEGGNILTNKTIAANITGSSGSCTGNSATATTAAKLGRNGNTGAPMTFNWNGQGGQPTWLWGSNDGSNIYVWNPSNFSVNYANSSGYANSAGSAPANGGTATNAEYISNESKYMRFHWSGQSGQPTWLWGGNDASNMYVWNPSNFSVNYANSAGSATSAGNGVTASGSNYVRFGNGTQICWGYKNENGGGTTSFAVAFNNTSYALALTSTTSSNNAPFITGCSTTSFSYERHGTSWDNIQWIAVGTWK